MKDENPWKKGLSVKLFRDVVDAGTKFRHEGAEFFTDEPDPETDGQPPFSPCIVLSAGNMKMFFRSPDDLLDSFVVGKSRLRDALPEIEWKCIGVCH